MEKLIENKQINKDSIPRIDLYMDQLLGLLESNLRHFSRNNDETVMTKTMINNYVKDNVIGKPHKKKYSYQQIVDLHLVYRLKSILSMQDIKKLLSEGDLTLDLYNELMNEIEISCDEINETKLDDKEKLLLAFRLSLEADYKKRLAEKLLDKIK